MKFVEPVFDVREQKMLHFFLAVVEEFRIPVGLITGFARQRVMVVGSVEFVDPFVEVFHVVGMHEVHDYGQTQFMCSANQLLEFFGRTATRGGSKKAGYMVSERSVVGMFGNSHQLHGVVAVFLNDRKYFFGKFTVGAYAFLFLRHPDMRFVNQQAADLRGIERIALPVERFGGGPELSRVIFSRIVLNHSGRIGRNAVQPAVIAVDMEFVERSVAQPVAVHRCGEKGAPYACGILVHADFGALPIVEIAEDVDIVCPGQPFAQPPTVQCVVPLPSEIAVAVRIVDQRSRRLPDCCHFLLVTTVAAVYQPFDREQPLVAFYDRKPSGRFFHRRRCFIQIYEKFFYLCQRTKKTTFN